MTANIQHDAEHDELMMLRQRVPILEDVQASLQQEIGHLVVISHSLRAQLTYAEAQLTREREKVAALETNTRE